MATKKSGGKPLVIVESPAKARTIGKFLGSGYNIEASIGHVRDLPSNASEVPAELKDQAWSRLGIDIEHDFKPLYVVPKEKKEQLRKLKALAKNASLLLLATDEDREGESISWHLVQVLQPKCEVKRLVFHEITKEAIKNALAKPREIDQSLVDAQEARRVVDRLYGYSVSPLLWRKIRPKLSAGRVQSVAVRLIVERERERIKFRTASYFDVKGEFQAKGSEAFEAGLISVGGKRVAIGKDFDPDTGKLKPVSDPPLHLQAAETEHLIERLRGKPAQVRSVESKPYVERPAPPFTTSTLQQEAGRKLRFSAQRTMRAAQRLYENGFITYMRTDSTTLSTEGLASARSVIEKEYGAQHWHKDGRQYQTKVRNAQEAHEAIRPAGDFVHPRDLGDDAGDDGRAVYELVWRRTVASQMKDSYGKRTTLAIGIADAEFQVSGKTIEYPGYRLAYVEDFEDQTVEAAAAEGERVLPNVKQGDGLETKALTPQAHETQPPARLTEASLIKELEARGIGRPSTYASIIETILARDYCFKKGTALVPTFTAFAVVQLLDRHLHDLVDYEFTAKMEEELDEISNGQKDRLTYLRTFYSGNGKPGLKAKIETANENSSPQEVCLIMSWPDGLGLDGKHSKDLIEVRVGRYGPYLGRKGGVRVTLPDELPPDELTPELAKELLDKSELGPRTLGKDPKTGLEVFVKTGRFGPYVQLGTMEEAGKGKKPKMASLLRGWQPETVTFEQALAVLALPREVGQRPDPETGKPEPILAKDGRFGPYLQAGKDTRSIPADRTPLDITLEEALALFAQPKARSRRAAPPPLRELGKRPGSEVTVKLMDGRYGPYVTDGTTNASLPKGESAEQLTLARALELLEARAAAGPPKKKRKGRKARV